MKDQKKIKCPHCGIEYTKKGIGTHIWRMHGEGQSHDPNRGYKNDRRAWNKGLTKDTSSGVQRQAEAQAGRIGSFRGRTHTKETKEKISKALSKNNHGGRCKWYRVSGVYVQGTWERDLAKKMNELNISWEKIKTNSFTFSYIREGKNHHYTPDFRVGELLLEVKGYWWGNDKEKMKLVQEQNSIPSLRIVEKDLYQKLLQASSKDEFLELL